MADRTITDSPALDIDLIVGLVALAWAITAMYVQPLSSIVGSEVAAAAALGCLGRWYARHMGGNVLGRFESPRPKE